MHFILASRSAWLALALLIPMIALWEWHWRREGYPPSPDDNRHLWAENRTRVDGLSPDDVVLVGSSRVFFDIQLDVWEEVTGRKPIQLAMAGSCPTPVFQDIVDNTDFSGTILIGVSPPLFFLGSGPGLSLWDKPANWVRHFHERTYAQRFNHCIGKPAQWTFSFLENDENDFSNDLDLESIIDRIPMHGRVPYPPPFPWFGYLDDDRNMTMLDRVTTDTAYAGMIKRTWQYLVGGGPPPDTTMIHNTIARVFEITTEYVDRFRERGGQVVFVRCPSSDWFLMVEKKGFPRERCWDVLLEKTGAPGYHFEDHDFMSRYVLPEWSHMSAPDARTFTRDLVTRMQKDNVLR